MLNMDEINAEITKLEKCDYTTYDICTKLAILYIVREHYNKSRGGTSPITSQPSMSGPSMAK